MKKWLLWVVSFCMILIISGCSLTEEKAQVTTDAGKEEMSFNDLLAEYVNNFDGFRKKYVSAEIKVSGKIKEIKENEQIELENCNSVLAGESILLENGWYLFLKEKTSDKKFQVGDEVTVESRIVSVKIKNQEKLIYLASYDSKNCEYNDNQTKIQKRGSV